VRDRCGLAPLSSPDRKEDDSDSASLEARALWKELGGSEEEYFESG